MKPATGYLSGRRIVVTRAPHQAGELAALLEERGAQPVLYPCIDIALPESGERLDAALRSAAKGDYDWLVVTSSNTARALSQRLQVLDLSLNDIRVAAVGPATGRAVKELLRIDVDVLATEHVAESLASQLPLTPGQWVLLPQSAIARPVLADRLRAAGVTVTAVNAYRTVPGQGGDDVPAMLAAGRIDAVTFTSSSTVRYFLQRLSSEGGEAADLAEICLAVVGPVTAETAREHGLVVTVMPSEYTLPALVEDLELYFRQPAVTSDRQPTFNDLPPTLSGGEEYV